jgi:hypothetical protein
MALAADGTRHREPVGRAVRARIIRPFEFREGGLI